MAADKSLSAETTLEWTGERFLPEIGGEIGLEHAHRYLIARQLARGRAVLDIACGEGYGSAMLIEVAASVIGVDIDERSIAHASAKYRRPGLQFRVGRADQMPLPDESIDLIVSFETIEHHREHDAMMRECRRVLKPGGVVCISSPDRYEYSERPGLINDYHVKELSTAEFEALLRSQFRHVRLFGQRVRYGSVIGPIGGEPTRVSTFENVDGNVTESDGLARPMYIVAYASDKPLPETPVAGLYFSESIHPHTGEIAGLTALVGERDRELVAMREVAERNAAAAVRIFEVEASLSAANSRVVEAEASLSAANSKMVETEASLSAANSQHRQLTESLASMQRVINDKDAAAAILRAEVAALRGSTSWRVTAPLRALSPAIAQPRRAIRAARRRLGGVARTVYRELPVSHRLRMRMKDLAYSTFGFAISDTASYRAWRAQRTPEAELQQAVLAPTVLGAATATTEALDDYKAMIEHAKTHRRARIETAAPRPENILRFDEARARACLESMRLKAPERPVISVVIPVYGKLALTAECLESLCRAKNALSYEVIVVDDGSTDATPELLPRIPGLRYLKNDQNLGFVRTCNHGASIARGEFVVFLNNDVQVTDGWLDALVSVLRSWPNAGAVGPRISYPNGRLQEAGTALNRDGSATMIGLAEDPSTPAYSTTRVVDYCSGAALMLRTELFHELGGFELDLAPSYCEDVDLCLKVRARGLEVVYVAESRIVHHLSATSNALHERYKAWWGTRNQQKLAERWQPMLDAMNEVRLIAFYLPQFHPIPQNDRWWGRGFTEWTNVTRAKPNFVGHQQPLLPAELGFYDLRMAETMRAQAELARRYGIFGFCFYYYWFAGRRLLETPIERMLESGDPDMPFCLCWANENWTRRWDGQDAEILIAQDHSPQDDDAVILDLIRYMRDPRYIRVRGRPILLVYRTSAFPDIGATAQRWRAACRTAGLGEIMLLAVESQEAAGRSRDPRGFGFDGAIEFPPHQMGVPSEMPPRLNPAFEGQLYDYRATARRYLEREWPDYPFWRGVMPRWDNTARRQDRSGVFVGSTPGAYQGWLEATVEQTRTMHQGEDRMVFLNAWNEWAEGAHLEPDNTFGHAYLEATRNALDAHLLSRK
jgi:GT2 family glycosyltransferase/SAM-dependent methyltransferase